MNKLALTWAALKGLLNPFGSVFESLADHALGKVNYAIDGIDVGKREKVQSALNVATKALAVLTAIAFLCPVKWQTAYKATIDAVAEVCTSLFDLHLDTTELLGIKEKFVVAYAEWRGDDDETCVDESALAK